MIIGNGNRRTVSQAGYFDRFWGCPGCLRILSIAEIIELHCESCDVAVEPAEMRSGLFPKQLVTRRCHD
jgi:hypothetical protein